MAERLLTDSPMHVAPAFLGRRIASPMRRCLAFALDELVLIVPTVVTAIVFSLLSLYLFERPAYDALMMLGPTSYLVCSHTEKSLGEIRADPNWLKAQAIFFELGEKFRNDPLSG